MRLGGKAFGIEVSTTVLEDIEEHEMIRYKIQEGLPLEEPVIDFKQLNKIAKYQNRLKSYGLDFRKLNEIVKYQNQLKTYGIDFEKLNQIANYENRLHAVDLDLNELIEQYQDSYVKDKDFKKK